MKNNQAIAEQTQNTKIDWDKIKSKVAYLQEALSGNDVVSHEDKHKILKIRAKSLSLQKTEYDSNQENINIIEFLLGTESYAFETEFVREVCLLNNFTPLPGLPDFVLGIINIRGQILSIVDINKLLNLPVKGLGELNKIIVIHNAKMEFGILADSILGTRSISINSIQTSYTSMPGTGAEYLKGVTSGHIIILDAAKILNDEKIIIRQDI
ncbi:MAG: chemotaxis protein CheW [Bacteroidetes bacterium]|nr:chemotaxis protein CheW [Bacteroidota bacterium]MBU1114409.1 chemotaxis protein CheW [Bacteroidota bacterium]MBU1797210.1 chemotaxis protein CheW [Bacteroidota bacterium]